MDARFISATNVALQQAVEDGSFRSDLYHRLNGIVVELPPLRDCGPDIALLARHFVPHSGSARASAISTSRTTLVPRSRRIDGRGTCGSNA